MMNLFSICIIEFYYADMIDDIIGKRLKGHQELWVELNTNKFNGENSTKAIEYINKQNLHVTIGFCNGLEGFKKEVEARRKIWLEKGIFVPKIITKL